MSKCILRVSENDLFSNVLIAKKPCFDIKLVHVWLEVRREVILCENLYDMVWVIILDCMEVSGILAEVAI